MAKQKVRFAPVKLRGSAAIKTQRVRQASGKYVTMRFLDANSPTFATDLSKVFEQNVASARQANAAPKIMKTLAMHRILVSDDLPAGKKSKTKGKPRQPKK